MHFCVTDSQSRKKFTNTKNLLSFTRMSKRASDYWQYQLFLSGKLPKYRASPSLLNIGDWAESSNLSDLLVIKKKTTHCLDSTQ